MHLIKRMAFFGMALLLVITGPTFAQNDDCALFQDEIAVLEARESSLAGELAAARDELNAIDAQLGVSTFDLLAGTALLDPANPAYNPAAANALQRATTLVIIIAKTYDDLQLVQSTLVLLRNAAAEGCVGTTSTPIGTGGTSGTFGECIDGMMVLENTVGAGGDEIILAPCDTGTSVGSDGGGTSGSFGECIDGMMVLDSTVGQGGDEIILVPCGTDATSEGGITAAVPNVPKEDPYDGWRLYVPGTLSYSYTDPADTRQGEQGTSISFYLGDDGVLYDATLFFYHACEQSGSITFTSESTFHLDFVGIENGTSQYWHTNTDVAILTNTFDENGRIPVSITPAAVMVYHENQPPHITGTFAQSTDEAAYLERYDVGYYAQRACGSG